MRRRARKGGRTAANLIRKLDLVHARYIRRRDGYRCVLCGSTDGVQCAHLVSRKNMATRWDIEPDGCCHTLCARCHAHNHQDNPKEFADWFVGKFGRERLNAIIRRANEIPRFTADELEDKLRKITKLLEEPA